MRSDPLVVVARLAEVFDDLQIPYLVGGSLASSMHGIPRATNDADFAAIVTARHAGALKQALEGDFYVDEEMILDAIRHRTSFNVIHLATMFKADVFIVADTGWTHEQMVRVRLEPIPAGAGRLVRFASPEDTVLQKLIWYRDGGEVSEQQWKDIQGVLKVQGTLLDFAYLEEHARTLNVADLLKRVREFIP